MIATTLALLAGTAPRQQNYTFLISLALMVAIFYFLLIRPQQRRVRQQRSLIESLDVGDEIVTIGGMFGTIKRLDDESVTIDPGDGRGLRFVRQAIARKLVQDENEGMEASEES